MKFIDDEPYVLYFESHEISESELFRFRTERIKHMGLDVEKMNKWKIVLGGGGILGNEIAYNLAVLGIGNITIIDYGTVDWYNVYRQHLFTKNGHWNKATKKRIVSNII